MSESFRVLVVEDNIHTRRAVAHVVIDLFPSALVVEVGDGEEALQKGRSEAWDLVVLDITLPKLSGLEVLYQLKPDKPDLSVIMLSLHDEPDYVLQCLEYGASGYLGKDTVADELGPAVHAVLNGDNYISRQIAERLPRRSG